MKNIMMVQVLLVSLMSGVGLSADDAKSQKADYLATGFAEPPDSARPWVYAFIVNGNLSKEGITADLEALKRAGISGLLVFDGTQKVPPGPARFMSPLWMELFNHLIAEAKRLGLTVSMNNDAGWTGSGGPWNTPENSPQRVVWSEMQVTGPKEIEVSVPMPDIKLDYYREIALLAFPTPKSEQEGKPYRIERFDSTKSFGGKEDWSGYVGHPRRVMTNPSWPVIEPASCVDRSKIVDLSGKLGENSTLKWQVPEGQWTILRLGHTSTGSKNHPATPEGTGLECDKLSKTALDAHFAGYIQKLVDAAGPEAGKTLGGTHIDSWEVGTQNWTPLMREEFRKRSGYDLLPFLPVFSGRVVDTLERSERFLWDFREVIAQLMVENYAGHMRELARKNGMQLSIQPYNGLCDEYRYASQADIPMCEFWSDTPAFAGDWVPRISSAAHTYGKNIVAAEAFTSSSDRWKFHPAKYKIGADWAFSEGVNRLVFHRFVMQPWRDRSPGVTFGPFGGHFDRTQTWWDLSRAWNDYLARCQFLLQQGVFVADILFLAPEGSPVQIDYPIPATQRGGAWPDRPGYNFDGCAAEVLSKRVVVKNNMLTLPEGGQYRLLVLPSYNADHQPVAIYGGYDKGNYTSKIFQRPVPAFETMTPAVLRRVMELVKDGATVLGTRPLKSPSLMGFPQCDEEIQQLADELWGKDAGASGVGEHTYGKGRVIWGSTPEKIFASMNVPPDFDTEAELKGKVRFAHRRTADGADIYFVANKTDQVVSGACLFRVSGKQPELWRPETGKIERGVAFSAANGCSRVLLQLEPTESVFVVFRDQASGNEVPVVAKPVTTTWTILHEITGPWTLRFPPNWEAPESVILEKLISWSDHPDVGVKHFSGTAVYTKTLSIPQDLLGKDHSLYLDLGNVEVIAEVRLNGTNLGTLWKRPFRTDITSATKAGDNVLEVRVVNLWPNRLIRDAGLPKDKQLSWTTWNPYKKSDPLLKSGLLGPVTLLMGPGSK